MGAQWKQALREVNAQKKGKITGKLVREIMVAAKLGGPDPALNARLYAALESARKASVTRETIDRAIKKGSGQLDEKITFENVVYEGFAPHRVPVVVECLTDNRNRTAPEIRVLFKNGQLGQPGSTAFLFEHLGVVEASHPDMARDAETDAIESGADNVTQFTGEDVPEGHQGATFTCAITALDAASKGLVKAGWKTIASEMRYIAKNPADLPEAQRKEVLDFLNALDDHDDVHRVYAGLK
ncbi:MAG: YebC/PmpR family DNA-binding transcriptional regulator [Pedosphaera sp.]|nr:YebC/PmpR family DNA-binding transcriptional regulator [Pedosphaera sp.]MST00763.1 YebC/PmpR family DNA-binding transcriptional regulator [Pedosphaera sp.]